MIDLPCSPQEVDHVLRRSYDVAGRVEGVVYEHGQKGVGVKSAYFPSLLTQ